MESVAVRPEEMGSVKIISTRGKMAYNFPRVLGSEDEKRAICYLSVNDSLPQSCCWNDFCAMGWPQCSSESVTPWCRCGIYIFTGRVISWPNDDDNAAVLGLGDARGYIVLTTRSARSARYRVRGSATVVSTCEARAPYKGNRVVANHISHARSEQRHRLLQYCKSSSL